MCHCALSVSLFVVVFVIGPGPGSCSAAAMLTVEWVVVSVVVSSGDIILSRCLFALVVFNVLFAGGMGKGPATGGNTGPGHWRDVLGCCICVLSES